MWVPIPAVSRFHGSKDRNPVRNMIGPLARLKMKKSFPAILGFMPALIVILFAFPFCKSPVASLPVDPVKDNPSFANDIQPIFNNNCVNVSCHGQSAQGNMSLIDGAAYQYIVNIASSEVPSKERLLPYNPTDSYLVIKIEGRQPVGARMPAAKDRLSDAHIQNIRNWISKGARDN